MCDGQAITGRPALTSHGGPGPPFPREGVRCRHVLPYGRSGAGPAACLRPKAPYGSPPHLPAFNAVAGSGAPKSKGAACH
jgi:hypothetical protein